jgi:hypothetical protein
MQLPGSRRGKMSCLVTVALLCALWPQRGRADNADLQAARTAYNDMQYEQA